MREMLIKCTKRLYKNQPLPVQNHLPLRYTEVYNMPKDAKKLAPFIESKARTWYRLTNKNKTGFMDKSDFNDMAETFIKEFKLDEKTGNELRAWLVDGWDALIEQGKTKLAGEKSLVSQDTTPFTLLIAEKIAKGERINEDLYINAYNEVINANKELFPTVLAQMVSSFFDVFDTDNDGFITEENMVRGLKCFGIDQSDALRKIFSELDKSGSGKLDRDSYIAAWVEFMTGFNEGAPMAKYLNPDIL